MYSHIQADSNSAFLRFITAGENIEWDANNYCTALALERDGKAAQFNVFRFYTSAQPAHDLLTQVAREIDPAPINGLWTQRWEVVDLDAETIAANQAAQAAATLSAYDTVLTEHLDKTAQARRWDSRITLAVRAAYPNPWQADAKAFGTWMDTCNALAYQWMNEVQAGTRAMPVSTAAFLAALPPMVWPGPETV